MHAHEIVFFFFPTVTPLTLRGCWYESDKRIHKLRGFFLWTYKRMNCIQLSTLWHCLHVLFPAKTKKKKKWWFTNELLIMSEARSWSIYFLPLFVNLIRIFHSIDRLVDTWQHDIDEIDWYYGRVTSNNTQSPFQ